MRFVFEIDTDNDAFAGAAAEQRQPVAGAGHAVIGPGYWMYETTGLLRPVIKAYLRGDPLDERQIAMMRAYLRQWVNAEVWDMNPHANEEDRAWLNALRLAVNFLTSREAITMWLEKAIEGGLDPL
jgi:hypothetical protein